MQFTPTDDELLPYPRVTHHTRWPGCEISEEYLVPQEDRSAVLEQLYPFTEVPSLEMRMLDIHENKEFVVGEFKVVRESGMNMLVSPYYYQSGGSVIDWAPIESSDDDLDHGDPFDDEVDDDDDDTDDEESVAITGFNMTMMAQSVRPGAHDRLTGLIIRQHEGPGLF